jgi:hypothetical protein
MKVPARRRECALTGRFQVTGDPPDPELWIPAACNGLREQLEHRQADLPPVLVAISVAGGVEKHTRATRVTGDVGKHQLDDARFLRGRRPPRRTCQSGSAGSRGDALWCGLVSRQTHMRVPVAAIRGAATARGVCPPGEARESKRECPEYRRCRRRCWARHPRHRNRACR